MRRFVKRFRDLINSASIFLTTHKCEDGLSNGPRGSAWALLHPSLVWILIFPSVAPIRTDYRLVGPRRLKGIDSRCIPFGNLLHFHKH
jgi:hypothetical protein